MLVHIIVLAKSTQSTNLYAFWPFYRQLVIGQDDVLRNQMIGSTCQLFTPMIPLLPWRKEKTIVKMLHPHPTQMVSRQRVNNMIPQERDTMLTDCES